MEIQDLITEALKDLGHAEVLKNGKIKVTTRIGSARFKIQGMKFTCCSTTVDIGDTFEINLHEPDSIKKVAIMVLKCLHRGATISPTHGNYPACSSCPFNVEERQSVIASPERHLRNNPLRL